MKRLEIVHQGDKLNPIENKFNLFCLSSAIECKGVLFWTCLFLISWTKSDPVANLV